MLKKNIIYYCLTLICFFVFSLHAEVQKLHKEDVKKIMSQILERHVQKREISTDILRHSFKIYIDQFDPNRVYLLESEVNPFIHMSQSAIRKALQEYQRDDFSSYEKLNQVIENAIQRAQKHRQAWIKREANQFETSAQISVRHQNKDQYSKNFAKTLNELQDRQNIELLHFIEAQADRQPLSEKVELQLIKIYDNKRRSFENQYTFTETNGYQMPSEEKENIFAMHIIKALAKSLDAHTSFFNQNEAYDMKVRLEKGFDGIGIVLGKSEKGYQIIKILEGSPAEASGRVALNDYLLKIDGQDISHNSLSDVMKMLRGKNGSFVSLEIKRETFSESKVKERYFTVHFKRAPIIVNDGRAELYFTQFGQGVIGTIKLDSFYQGDNGISSEKDVRDAIAKLEAQGEIKGLILDLRNNSGGFLTQAVKVAGLFITNGVVVISKYSNGEQKYYRDMDGKVSYEGPLVVLTSRATASAAEIVAQALQDYGVAIVVGDEQTYGKGTIQSQTVTGNQDSTSYFKVTVGKYYTVSGKTPQIQGVKADVIVPSPYSLEQIGEEYLDYPINQDQIPESFVDALNDIDPGLKPWYLRYYMPTLQKRNYTWKQLLPELKKNSKNRLLTNNSYKDYLTKGQFDEEHAYEKQLEIIQEQDPQLIETVNIVKDMIIFEEKMNKKNRMGVTATELIAQ